MSEQFPELHELPDHTIVDRRIENGQQVTTVVVDGAFETFEVPVRTVRAVRALLEGNDNE